MMNFDIYNCPDDWIELQGNTIHEMILDGAHKAGNISLLAKETKIPYHRLRKFTCIKSKRTNIFIMDLRKILFYLRKIDDTNWDNKIIPLSLGRNRMIKNPIFPISFFISLWC